MKQLMKIVTKYTCIELILNIPRIYTSYTVIRCSYNKSPELSQKGWLKLCTNLIQNENKVEKLS